MSKTDQIEAIAFGTRRIGAGEAVLVIAEIGINHEGDAETCARMIEQAAQAGADAIKLQTIDADLNYAPDTESHRLFKAAELTREQTTRMFALARERGVEPFTTIGDLATLAWVDALNPAGYKISSGLLTCTPIIERAARTSRPLLMSTGMAEIADIDRAVEAAVAAGSRDVALFQCTSLYPAPWDTLDLAAIRWLEDRYGIPVGFSDHSTGSEAAPLSVAAGAVMVEKHFSLDPKRPGFDHALSLDPREFRRMVDSIRLAETAHGRPEKQLQPETRATRQRMSRYLGVTMPVAAGERLDETNLSFLRLANAPDALPASDFDKVNGARATRDLEAFTVLTGGMFTNG